MKDIARADIDRLVGLPREEREKLDFSRSRFSHLNLAGVDLSGLNMEWSDFEDVSFAGADLTGVNLANVRCVNTSFAAANLRDADLSGAALRGCDLHNAHIEGAHLYSANLEHARLDGIVDDERTQFFRLYPPATGAFLGYKKCFNDLLVQLLIPADAKRTSATLHSCRTNKAKVLSIKNFDGSRSYDEAMSLVDPNFIYRVGQWLEVGNFNEDRWFDSTTGIHYWLTPEEAMAY